MLQANTNALFSDRYQSVVPSHAKPTLYPVAINAGLNRKAVKVCYILIPSGISLVGWMKPDKCLWLNSSWFNSWISFAVVYKHA